MEGDHSIVRVERHWLVDGHAANRAVLYVDTCCPLPSARLTKEPSPSSSMPFCPPSLPVRNMALHNPASHHRNQKLQEQLTPLTLSADLTLCHQPFGMKSASPRPIVASCPYFSTVPFHFSSVRPDKIMEQLPFFALHHLFTPKSCRTILVLQDLLCSLEHGVADLRREQSDDLGSGQL